MVIAMAVNMPMIYDVVYPALLVNFKSLRPPRDPRFGVAMDFMTGTIVMSYAVDTRNRTARHVTVATRAQIDDGLPIDYDKCIKHLWIAANEPDD